LQILFIFFEIYQNLAKIEGVVSVFAVSGEVDLMLEIIARDIQHYSQVVLQAMYRGPASNLVNNF
jgi:Lrp/AsnC family leucine-responsive transcriptional regulator